MVHMIKLVCTDKVCPSYSKIRTVRLEQVAIGVLARPDYLCSGCLRIMSDHHPEGTIHD